MYCKNCNCKSCDATRNGGLITDELIEIKIIHTM